MGELTAAEMGLRIAVAFVAGAIIGWERESHGRPAGLRTTILACVASAVAMAVSQQLFARVSAMPGISSWRPDPARLGAGILTGIGFLGAGTILRHADFIRGVTTAATLWFVTVLGITFGAGEFILGGIGVILAVFTLMVLPLFEKHIHSDRYATLTVVSTLEGATEQELVTRIQNAGPLVKQVRLSYDLQQKEKTFICDVKMLRSDALELSTKVVSLLLQCPGVLRVSWH